jgi:hypothetical protein
MITGQYTMTEAVQVGEQATIAVHNFYYICVRKAHSFRCGMDSKYIKEVRTSLMYELHCNIFYQKGILLSKM